MIKHAVETIFNIERYGITSLMIFFLFFTGMLVWAFCLNREVIDKMSQLPLDDDNEHSPSTLAQND